MYSLQMHAHDETIELPLDLTRKHEHFRSSRYRAPLRSVVFFKDLYDAAVSTETDCINRQSVRCYLLL